MMIRRRSRTCMVAAAALLWASALFAADSGELVLHRWTLEQGTSVDDLFSAVAVDPSGSVYAVGATSGTFSLNISSGASDAFVAKYDLSGGLIWLRQFGTWRDDEAVAVAVDTAGAVYVAGNSKGNLLGPATGTYFYSKVFITKYDSSGTQIWLRQLFSEENDKVHALAVMPSGAVVITGSTEGKIDGVTNNVGNEDLFTACYSSTGSLVWIHQIGTVENDEGRAVCADADGNVYVGGMTRGGFTTATQSVYDDGVLMKYSSAGTALWSSPVQFGTLGNDDVEALVTDRAGSLYVTGRLGVSDLTTTNKQDLFVAKYNSAGTRVWISTEGTTSDEYGYAITIDSANYLIAAGYASGNLNGRSNAGYQDVVVLKYDTDGNRQWTYLYGSSRTDVAYSVAVDSANNVYVAGLSDGSLGSAVNAGGNDAFLFKIRPNFRPSLSWTGEAGYGGDGVAPDRDAAAVPFTFRINYTDPDDHDPRGRYPAVHIYLFPHAEISGSPFTLTQTDPSDRVVTDGKLYSYTATLPPGQYYYSFEAYDMHGSSAAGVAGVEYAGPVVIGTLPSASTAKLYHGIFKPGEKEHCYLSCDIPSAGELKVTIYDSLGKSVRELYNAPVSAGIITLLWDGRATDGTMCASGVYLIDVRAPGIKQTKRAVVVR